MSNTDSSSLPKLPHDIFRLVLTRYTWAWKTAEKWHVSFCLDSSRAGTPVRAFTANHLALRRLQKVSKDWEESIKPLLARLDAQLPLTQRSPNFPSTFELHPFFFSQEAEQFFSWAAHGGRNGHQRPTNIALAQLPFLRDDLSSPPTQGFTFNSASNVGSISFGTNTRVQVSDILSSIVSAVEQGARLDLRALADQHAIPGVKHSPWPAVRQPLPITTPPVTTPGRSRPTVVHVGGEGSSGTVTAASISRPVAMADARKLLEGRATMDDFIKLCEVPLSGMPQESEGHNSERAQEKGREKGKRWWRRVKAWVTRKGKQ